MAHPIIRAICYDNRHFELFANFTVITLVYLPSRNPANKLLVNYRSQASKLSRNRGFLFLVTKRVKALIILLNLSNLPNYELRHCNPYL